MKYPKDRFDEFPEMLKRRGAHRAPRTWGSKARAWVVAIIMFVVLVGAGVGVMWFIDNQVKFAGNTGGQDAAVQASATATASPTPAAPQATINPDMKLTVLNGTGTSGLATAGAEVLNAAGWKTTYTVGAGSSDHVTTSIVIRDESAMSDALAIQQALGLGEISVDPYTASEDGMIMIFLGADAESKLM